MGGKPRLMDGMDNSLSHVGFFQAARLLMLPLLIDKLHDVFEATAASPLIHSHDLRCGNCSLLLMLVWNGAHGFQACVQSAEGRTYYEKLLFSNRPA